MFSGVTSQSIKLYVFDGIIIYVKFGFKSHKTLGLREFDIAPVQFSSVGYSISNIGICRQLISLFYVIKFEI